MKSFKWIRCDSAFSWKKFFFEKNYKTYFSFLFFSQENLKAKENNLLRYFTHLYHLFATNLYFLSIPLNSIIHFFLFPLLSFFLDLPWPSFLRKSLKKMKTIFLFFVFLFFSAHLCYLPGVAPKDYVADDRLVIKVFFVSLLYSVLIFFLIFFPNYSFLLKIPFLHNSSLSLSVLILTYFVSL
jgi:hypothetical protein